MDSDGLRAFRSRRPNTLASGWSCCAAFWPGWELLAGDRLRARCSISGCDLARLARVGDWYEARSVERLSGFGRRGGGFICDASGPAVGALVLRRFGGEDSIELGR